MIRWKPSLILAGLFCTAVASVPGAAQTVISYPDFSTTSGLSTVGNTGTTTTGDGTVLRIVPSSPGQAGAAYSTTPVTLGSNATFSTQFNFRFTSPGGIDPADGLTFVLAASPSGLGQAGGGLGYQGVGNSVAIELDTFNNGEIGSNHVAVDLNGDLSNMFATSAYGNASCDFSGNNPNTRAGCLSNGDLWTASITYDGALLNVSLLDPAEGGIFKALTNVPLSISSYLGTNTAYVGFTGSTGSGYENEDITSWQFANTATLPVITSSVPEASTWAMMMGGLGVVGGSLRRRRTGTRVSFA